MPNARARWITSLPIAFLADRTAAEDRERPAAEAARFAERLLVPLVRAQRRDVVVDAAIEVDEVAHRELGDRGGVLARAVRDVHAARRRRARVDRVHSGAGADDEREARARLEVRLADLRAAHDQDLGIRLAELRRERVTVELRVDLELRAELLQTAGNERSELVRDEDSHGRPV
jgi:hypothetical protein